MLKDQKSCMILCKNKKLLTLVFLSDTKEELYRVKCILSYSIDVKHSAIIH